MEGKKDIVIYAMSSQFEWEAGIINRNRQVVNQLKNHPNVDKVLVVGYWPYSFWRAGREYIKGKIYQKNEKTVLKGLSYKVDKIENNLFFLTGLFETSLSGILKKLNFENPLHWSFNPMSTQFLKNETAIFDAVDDWSVHPIYEHYKDRLLKNYKKIEEKAGCIFMVSEGLNKLFENHQNKYWIPNGVDLKHYQNENIKIEHFELNKKDQPVVGYIGHIQKRFDLDLAVFLAKRNPEVKFVYIGSIWKEIEENFKKQLLVHKNVSFLGPKAYKEAPKYLQHFDVAILPHHVNAFTNSMNPMKIYEYLACGKPVVSTNVAGTKDFGDLVYTAAYPEQFQRFLEKALNEVNNEELAEKRLKFIKNHTWEQRVEEMMEIVSCL